jgi:hypothetical protein
MSQATSRKNCKKLRHCLYCDAALVRRLGRHSGFKGVMEGCCVRSYGGMLT